MAKQQTKKITIKKDNTAVAKPKVLNKKATMNLTDKVTKYGSYKDINTLMGASIAKGSMSQDVRNKGVKKLDSLKKALDKKAKPDSIRKYNEQSEKVKNFFNKKK